MVIAYLEYFSVRYLLRLYFNLPSFILNIFGQTRPVFSFISLFLFGELIFLLLTTGQNPIVLTLNIHFMKLLNHYIC